MDDKVKRYYCQTKELCSFKNEFASNQRCFADYAVRISCPNLIRKDGLTWREGSKENEALLKI